MPSMHPIEKPDAKHQRPLRVTKELVIIFMFKRRSALGTTPPTSWDPRPWGALCLVGGLEIPLGQSGAAMVRAS